MIGLFFGSFDPVHIGHVNVVTTALNSGKVDKVIVIPAYKSVWKNTETKFAYRYIMLEEAFKGISNVTISNVEETISAMEPLPTYKVIDHLKWSGLKEFVIITTPETYGEVPQWQHGKEILQDNKFLIVSSSHFCDADRYDLSEDIHDGDELIYVADIAICSTNLRNKIKNNQIVQPFIQDSVVKIINALKLYK